MSRNQPKKPTGEAGIIKVGGGIFGPSARFEKLAFPESKDQMEAFVTNAFLPGAINCGFIPEGTTTTKNDEQDLDFTLTFPNGDIGELELMEIAHLEDVQGSYEDAPDCNVPYEFAEKVLAKIRKKSNKYGSLGKSKRYLLVYPTDWKFVPSMTAEKLVSFWLDDSPTNFAGIYLFIPVTPDDGPMKQLYPTEEDWDGFDPEAYRKNKATNFDPKKLQSGRIRIGVILMTIIALLGLLLTIDFIN